MTSPRFLCVSFGFIAAAAAVACSAEPSSDAGAEPTRATEQAQISDAASMTQRPDGQFDVVCKDGRREVATAAQIAAQQICNGGSSSGGSSSGGTGGAGRIIIFGTSDSCDPNRIVASVTSATDCMTLSDSDRSWSVSVGGRCIDIPDTTVRKACLSNQPGRVLIYGTSDSCDDSRIVASVGEQTDCLTLSDSDRSWSVKVNGQCIDISDTTVRKACMANQPNRVLVYGTTDSCDDSRLVASVSALTDCNTLSDSDRSWSVKVNGQCIDISDTTVRKACMLHQP